ncbi:putative LPS assembly protein LptD [Wenyingzhuangia fucanilytica]|uniref:putative LPS assembly protein LptD n=1 Tax=Wenyingzhuangia fucanilytica TaxID=1790137 RepID=UPI000B0B3A52|nr:putative LPS assembly protein LptD [Wenyingzhuangia fucanilytica]
MQTNRLYILLLVLFVCFSSLTTKAQDKTTDTNILTQAKDSIVQKDSSLPKVVNDSIGNVQNDSIPSIENDSIAPPPKKEAIQYIIEHSAKDYILEDLPNKKVNLYGEAHVVYGENDITAGKILIDYQTNTVQAKGIPDENGKYSQLPVFKTTGNETTQDSLIFNYKTKKAIIYGLETEQDGINTLGQKTKRVNDSTIFIRNIIFTTSDPRHPDYYLKTTKAKVVPGKKIITGPTNLVLADVPTPAIFPFAYFPLTKNRTSGIIFPTYGESFSQGFFLQNGGYYLALNDYFDLKLTADIYSNSSWGFNAASSYRVRYKFSGNFSFNYDNLISGIEGFSSYSVAKNFNLRWSHSQDSKASPSSRFSASVNLGSSQYFRQSVNESNNGLGLTNTLSSSVSYYKDFVGTPFNISLSANHRQNTNTQKVYLTLPSLQLNMDRQYPFAPKNGTKKNAFQKIGLTYSLKADNQVETTEDDFFSDRIFDNAKNGAQHNISMSTNMKLLKYFSLSPSMSYREVWYTDKIHKEYDSTSDQIVTDTISGFSSFRDYSASASVSTTIYGMFKFKNSNLKAIRHTMRPSVSYSYRPDFGFYYEQVQEDANATSFVTYSRFDNGIYGAPSRGVSNSLGFSLANTFEGKVANKDDLEGEDKKITILNSLNMSTSYNFTADSFKLSPVNLTAGTTLFKKMNLNFGASLDPYALVENSTTNNLERIDALSYKNGGPLFRMTRANFTTSYSFSSKDFQKKKEGDTSEDEEDSTAYDQELFGEDIRNTNDFSVDPEEESNEDEEKEENPNLPQYISSMPWNIRFSYSTNYSNSLGQDEITSSSLMFSGDVELSPGWKVGASSGYDFINKGFTYTSLRFSRDLRSWSMNFNWVPLGNYSSYYFFIGVKSSVLSDLKWDKRNVNRDF